jgi:hypothetical protein
VVSVTVIPQVSHSTRIPTAALRLCEDMARLEEACYHAVDSFLYLLDRTDAGTDPARLGLSRGRPAVSFRHDFL